MTSVRYLFLKKKKTPKNIYMYQYFFFCKFSVKITDGSSNDSRILKILLLINWKDFYNGTSLCAMYRVQDEISKYHWITETKQSPFQGPLWSHDQMLEDEI